MRVLGRKTTNRMRIEDPTQVLGTAPNPVRVRQLQLTLHKRGEPPQSVTVTKDVYTVGKDPGCDLVLSDSTVSRQHFQIITTRERFTIRDLDSTNGTAVNGTRVKEAFLLPGAVIHAGKVKLEFEPVYSSPLVLPEEVQSFGSLIAASASMCAIMGTLRKVAVAGTTVLLQGETGTGKSALAKAIHEESTRRAHPFVVFDCASVPPSLIESELFGAEKGAYTGAHAFRPGACERAQGGQLFVDEIEELPLELQAKLLRALDEREIRRLGGTQAIKLDFQIITASKQDLVEAVAEGKFRQDLYYRIAVVCINVPPLRNRKKDIPVLCDHFLKLGKHRRKFRHLSPDAQQQLLNYSWPGNLREMRNVLERLVCLGEENAFVNMPGKTGFERNYLKFDVHRPFKEAKDAIIERFEREYLEALLVETDGKIAKAARTAGLNRKYFYDLLHKHGLRKGSDME
ncbi:MAG: sigma 54-interacting transcriptional regulator [Deltaproteobacteria bacterium]|nr:sigma 54-interacting transcriptional regulator [Deltaproteobacteria bacterium]